MLAPQTMEQMLQIESIYNFGAGFVKNARLSLSVGASQGKGQQRADQVLRTQLPECLL